MISQDNPHIAAPTTMNTGFKRLGWSPFFEAFVPSEGNAYEVARVVGVRKKFYLVNTGEREFLAQCAGSLFHDPDALLPAVGDWVLLKEIHITAVLPRRNCLERKIPGGRNRKKGESSHSSQVIATNLDTVFIVCGMDRDFNLRRIERYLTLIYNCGISPAVVLTKADIHPDPEVFVNEVEATAFGVPVFAVSNLNRDSVSPLAAHLAPGQTVALIGSSGAGKSTLINTLYGSDIRQTGDVSVSLGKGKHTTTSRDLVVLPSGALVIDNPGIREIALGFEESQSSSAFPDIENLALSCRFTNCSHTNEPGCRVIEAASTGEIDSSRLSSYRKIRAELDYSTQREQKSAARVERERWKGVAQKIKSIKKRR